MDTNTHYRPHYDKYQQLGIFAGTFHIHATGFPPSDDDLEETRLSSGLRAFVVANEKDYIVVYELMAGKVINKTTI